MEFRECLSLLAKRPQHANEHCEEERHAQGQGLTVDTTAAEESIDSEEITNLKQLSSQELVQTFYRYQEKRVQIYTDFQQGFQVHQKTQQFPTFCSGITDRFSAVSEQINCIEKLLNAMQQKTIAGLFRKIQLAEKEKLLLTSALLIEKMRLSNAASQPEPDDSTIAFLERSLETLTNKHTECIVRINEILEDLRAESAHLEDAKA